MNIGQAAEASGVSAKMIRYYEQTRLIPKAYRKDSGYRDYSPSDVHMLRFIRRARDLGFAVNEINELLGLWRNTSRRSADVKRLAKAHIGELTERVVNLQQMIGTLQTLIEGCSGDDRPDCPILDELQENDVAKPLSRKVSRLNRLARHARKPQPKAATSYPVSKKKTRS